MSEGPVEAVIGIVIGNVAYLLGMLILGSVYSVTIGSLASNAFAGTADGIVTAWITIGALLAVADVLVVVGFFASLLNA